MEIESDLLHKIAYKIDASHIDCPSCDCVYFPKSADDVKDVINFALNNNKKITIRASGTNLVGDCLPDGGDIILDLSGMDNIYYNSVDAHLRKITVESGTILDDLNRVLGKNNLMFPVVPGSHAACTIGGMVATNAVGMRGFKYGKMSDWINWIEAIFVDENKNIIVKKLETKDEINEFCGSEGILGIAVRIDLKTTSKPKVTSLDFLSFDSIEELINSCESIITNKKDISAVEFINKTVVKWNNLQEKYYLLIEYENNNGFIKDKNEIDKIWALRDACYPTCASRDFVLIEDPQIEDKDKLKELLIWLDKNNIPSFGHIGMGIIHPHFKKDQKDLINAMYELAIKLGCKISGEHGVGVKKKEFLSDELKNRFVELKKKYDPLGIFGNGKII